MNAYTINRDKLKKSRKALRYLYSKIPETKGCMENINKPGGCGAWCCETISPAVLLVEFLNCWNNLKENFSNEKFLEILKKCLNTYICPEENKGCVFWDRETKLCGHHEYRPESCFLPDTWIFTSNGPVRIKNILAGDFILTHKGRYRKVISTLSRYYHGKVYNLMQQGNHIASACTGDHRILIARQKYKRDKIKPKWVMAQDLISKKGKVLGDYLMFPRMKNTLEDNSNTYINVLDFIKAREVGEFLLPFTGQTFKNHEVRGLPKYIKIDDDFLFMVGLYLAEGCSSSRSSLFTMHKDEVKHMERIQNYLNSLYMPSHLSIDHNTSRLRVDSCLFGRFMSELCGKLAQNKQLSPKLLRLLTPEQKMKIFEGWDTGDGHTTPTEGVHWSIVTISETLVVQMQQILLENGLYPRIHISWNKGNRGFVSYMLMVNKSSLPDWRPKAGQGSKIMYDENYIYGPLSEILVEEYSGPVIDIQVEEDESFVTSSGIVHNCRTYGIVPEEEFQSRYEALKVIYPETRPQCNLVSTVDGRKVTTKDTDQWWQELKNIEASIGVNPLDMHDRFGGTYRHYHEHILVFVFGEEYMSHFSDIRENSEPENKKKYIENILKSVKSFMNMEKDL